jgi:C1q domain
MIDFPASPTVGQLFTTGALTYKYNGTAWLGQQASSSIAIPDAPNDGVQYGRQSQAWTPVAGGGGGVWIGDTAPADKVKYPFWWSSASLQLSIWYNDGNSSQWVDTNAEPDTLQGASGPWLLADGTVAAPGLAWASEPGLGWYKPAAGTIATTGGGGVISYISTSGAGTTMALGPSGSATVAGLNIYNGSVFSPNYNALGLQAVSSGYTISELLGGTATAKPLTMAFPAGVFVNATGLQLNAPSTDANLVINKPTAAQQSVIWGRKAGINRWAMILGDANPELGTNAGCNFNILNYDDAGSYINSTFLIDRKTGAILTQQNPAFGVSINSSVVVGTVLFNLISNNRGNCYNAANGRFTAPVPGTYRFSWQHLLAGTNGAGEYRIGFAKNGTMFLFSIRNIAPSQFETITVAAAIVMNAGDYVTCQFVSGPGPLYLDAGFNNFSGEFLG